MRKANDLTLKEAIEKMMDVYKIKRRYDETGITASWPSLVGKSMANRTKELYIRDKKLFLKIESSVIRNELLMMRSQLINKINEQAKSNLVEEIIFL
jgi:predicted nucleic acid-binding Zn ribbon protein